MNAHQRRKNRRKGIFTQRDKDAADMLVSSLYRLDLSEVQFVYAHSAYWVYPSIAFNYQVSYQNNIVISNNSLWTIHENESETFAGVEALIY